MHNIGIASALYLVDGAVMVTPLGDSNIRTAERRVSRTKTLDGGVVITDSGFAHGDRTFIVALESTQSMWEALHDIFTITTLITVSTEEGCFSGAVESWKDYGDQISIKILIKEKISE